MHSLRTHSSNALSPFARNALGRILRCIGVLALTGLITAAPASSQALAKSSTSRQNLVQASRSQSRQQN